MEPRFDPFASVADEPDPGPHSAVCELLDTARRGFFPLRKIAVQRPNTESNRAAVLATLLGGRHQRPLDAWLLLHALQPILEGTPLALRTWARLLSTRVRCSPAAASQAFSVLEELNLVVRAQDGREPVLQLLMEDQSGRPWTRPGQVEESGPGYFTVPHAYWADGLSDRLTMPGKVMFLILLAETQNPKTPAFAMAVERAQQWYGISERSAERGYTELGKAGVLLVRRTKVVDPRHPAGRRDVYWRALAAPFGTDDRARLQSAASTIARQQATVEPEQPSGPKATRQRRSRATATRPAPVQVPR